MEVKYSYEYGEGLRWLGLHYSLQAGVQECEIKSEIAVQRRTVWDSSSEKSLG